MPLRNCLCLLASVPRATAKCSGAKLGMGGNCDRRLGVQGVAGTQRGRVDQPDHVAGERLVHGRPVLAEHRLGVLGGERPAGGGVGQHHAALEPARAHPDEGDPVAVGSVHVRLHLEHQAGERRVDRPRGSPSMSARGAGGGASSTSASSSRRTPKLGSAAPNSTGVDSPAEERLQVEVGADLGRAAPAPRPRRCPSPRRCARPPRVGGQTAPRWPGRRRPAVRVNAVNSPVRRSISAAEVAGDPRPARSAGSAAARSAARSRRAAPAARGRAGPTC